MYCPISMQYHHKMKRIYADFVPLHKSHFVYGISGLLEVTVFIQCVWQTSLLKQTRFSKFEEGVFDYHVILLSCKAACA